MAKSTIIVSDLSGVQLSPEQHALVTITVGGARYKADLALAEVEHIVAVARKLRKPGRKASS